jgi:hypothetical protein
MDTWASNAALVAYYEQQGFRLVGDRGYSYPAVRRLLARRHIQAVIPRRRDQRPDDRRHAVLDRVAYRVSPLHTRLGRPPRERAGAA